MRQFRLMVNNSSDTERRITTLEIQVSDLKEELSRLSDAFKLQINSNRPPAESGDTVTSGNAKLSQEEMEMINSKAPGEFGDTVTRGTTSGNEPGGKLSQESLSISATNKTKNGGGAGASTKPKKGSCSLLSVINPFLTDPFINRLMDNDLDLDHLYLSSPSSSSSSSSSSPSSPEGQRLPSVQRSWPAKNNKVCLALLSLELKHKYTHRADVYGEICRREYNICILDLLDSPAAVDDPTHFPPISPTLRIDCGVETTHIGLMDIDAFCVLGQTLYMFEGSNRKDLKSIYSVDISIPPDDRLVMKSELFEPCKMCRSKCSPVAIPTPDSQNIVVFPTRVVEHSNTFGGFELFDPVKRSSKELPSIKMNVDSCCRIFAYCFIDDTQLLVQVHDFPSISSMYVLDLDQLEEGWTHHTKIFGEVIDHIPTYTHHLGASSFKIIENRFGLTTTYGFHDLHHPKEFYNVLDDQFTALDKESAFFLFEDWEYMVTLLDHDEDKGECHICEAYVDRINGSVRTEYHIFLDVCLVELKRYIQDDAQGVSKSNPEYASCVKSVQFCLNLDGEYIVRLLPVFFTI